MPPRPYRQTRRAVTAAGTTDRILDAAQAVLTSEGAFTIDAVARGAGVSRVTVYSRYPDAAALQEAVLDRLAETGGLGAIPEAFMTQLPLDGLVRLTEIFAGFYSAHRTVLRRLNALAALAAGDAQRPPDRNRRRLQAITVLLERLVATPGFGTLDVAASARTVHALTSFEFFDQLSEAGDPAPGDTIARLTRDAVGAAPL